MPRYFFNVRGHAFEEIDLSGRVCPNDVAALGEALGVASAVMQKRLAELQIATDGSVEVEDEAHRCVLTLPLRAAAY